MPDVPELFFTSGWGHSGDDKTLHEDPDCRYLARAKSVNSCEATNPPRGTLCSNCSTGGSVEDLLDDAAVATDDEDDASSVPMIKTSNGLGTFILGPEPAAFQEWERRQEAGRDE